MRRTCLIYILTVQLALGLVLICLMFTGLTQGERLALDALGQLGKPYVLGARGPKTYDCSGLVIDCAQVEGVQDLPHAAVELYELGLFIPRWALLPGDMVCFDTVNDGDFCDHVGIYLGGNRFVHASSAKGEVVITELSGYYHEHYTGARRLVAGYV